MISEKSLHIVFAIIIIFFGALPVFAGSTPVCIELIITAVLIILMCAFVFYFYYPVIIPKLFLKKHLLWFGIVSIGFLLLFPQVWVVFFTFLLKITGNKHLGGGKQLLPAFLYTILFMMFGGFFRFMQEWFHNYRNRQELEKQNIKNELAILRSQVNPHFLFNTLNNIHSYAHLDADITSFSIIKLSEIMRYMLYQSDKEFVFLENEVDYIKSYIALEKLRIKAKDFVKFVINGNIQGFRIAPMLLIPFIENAFKHGKKRGESPGIMINLDVSQNQLIFSVGNYKKDPNNDEDQPEKVSGFGLKNIKRRLELIYPDKHELEINETDTKFNITLILKVFGS